MEGSLTYFNHKGHEVPRRQNRRPDLLQAVSITA